MLLLSAARRVRATSLVALAGLALAPAAPARALSGVCPDGSIFIVQHADAIPCRNAKRVAPEDLPPLNPEFLPRPYGWEVFNRETDPNNPYNLVGQGAPGTAPAPPPVSAPGPAPGPPGGATALAPGTGAPPPPAPAPAPVAMAAASTPAGLELALTPKDLEDLAAIIDLLQSRTPATLVRRDAEGASDLEMQLARSQAFEARVAGALAQRQAASGPVLAFRVQAQDTAEFWGNLTFVQGHMAFHPDTADAAQFGVLEGRLGALRPGERVLGYAVLPAHLDLAQPLEVYWNDQRFETTLAP